MRDEESPHFKPGINALVEHFRNRYEEKRLGQKETPAGLPAVFENRICLSVSETAYALGLSQKSIERMVKRGELRAKRVGRRVLVIRSDIEAWHSKEE